MFNYHFYLPCLASHIRSIVRPEFSSAEKALSSTQKTVMFIVVNKFHLIGGIGTNPHHLLFILFARNSASVSFKSIVLIFTDRFYEASQLSILFNSFITFMK